MNKEPILELVRTSLNRYTFRSPKVKAWVESNACGRTLNLFSGPTSLALDEYRNDLDPKMPADSHLDAVDCVRQLITESQTFDSIILDPPYSYRKGMEKYGGRSMSRFKMLADLVPTICNDNCSVISFGYHSTFLGTIRGYYLHKLCVFAHGGAQHCTIAITEKRIESYEH